MECFDQAMMKEALMEAQKAAAIGEVPVGVVLSCAGKIIARSHNLRESTQQATHHAEILAIEAACQAKGSWRLDDCCLYVTLEPCLMCAGAIIHARLGRLVYAARDPKAGAVHSVCEAFALPLNHQPALVSGLFAAESSALLKAFFQERRQKNKQDGSRSLRRSRALALQKHGQAGTY